jgi:ribose transport system ATP-binding protein
VTALDGVDLSLNAGEVVAVVGENGAGKSTLMRILAGVEHPDAGELQVMENKIKFRGRTSADAIRSGIALIHQELELCENIDVAGNILLGREPRRGPFLLRGRAHARTTAALEMVGLELDPSSSIEGLGIGQRQLIEIAKALSANARILIMDEPTASLTLAETTRLLEVIDELRHSGTAIIYISHRLREVERLADRVLVLRDGTAVGTLGKEELSHDAMVRLMIGRDLTGIHERSPISPGPERLRLRAFRSNAHPAHSVDLTLRAGEVVGLAGLVGSGRTELLRSIFGVDRAAGGEVLVDGRTLQSGSPARAMARGLALVPEDRKADGLFLEESVRSNLVISILKRLGRVWFRSGREERRTAAKAIHEFGVRAPHDRVAIAELSGGNQQKVSLAKWVLTKPRVLLLDEPTRGVDVGAKEEIYALIDRLAAQGVALLVVSSEMEEVLALSDRVLVMHEGRLAGELKSAEASEESLMQLATGRGHAA